MLNHLKLPFCLLAAYLLLFSGASLAAKLPKVDICHFDYEAGMFQPLAVPGNAVQPHLGHGDVLPGVDNEPPLPDLDEACMVIIPPVILAVAYIDVVDDGAGYDPTVDLEIVTLFDSDATPGLSVGDTVEVGAYPTTLDPCPDPSCPNVGAFTTNTIQTVIQVDATIASKDFVADGGIKVSLSNQGGSEFVNINRPGVAIIFTACDDVSVLGCFSDFTDLRASTILNPSTLPHSVYRNSILIDEPFLDIEIY